MQLPIVLAFDGKTPLQRQVFEAIRRLVLAGMIPPGHGLPGSRQLAITLGISRNTAVLAYQRLESEGYLTPRRGLSPVVNVNLPEHSLGIASTSWPARTRRVRAAAAERSPAPGLVDFKIGQPTAREFPLRTWRRIVGRQLLRGYRRYLRYGDVAGDPGLRAAVAQWLGPARGIAASAEDIVIVSGLPQALALIARVLRKPGWTAAVEDPCYGRMVDVLSDFDATIAPIPVDSNGMRVHRLDQRPADLVAVSPSHQFPLGYTLSLERRLWLLQWAAGTGAYVFEDDYDSDFRHEGAPLTALKGLDQAGRVIYFGTFSKSFGPGLRLAYISVPAALRTGIVDAKSRMDRGSSWLEQTAVCEFIESGHYASHLRRIRRHYVECRNALRTGLKERFGDIDVSGINGGMHLAWHLDRRHPTAPRLAAAAAPLGAKVYCIGQGHGRCLDDKKREARTLLLGYSSVSPRDYARGLDALAAAAARLAPRHRPAGARPTRA
jgi:GntR family transcriptional regulator / MocR family aminotransferase